jgi:hypothetical protein
MIVVKIFNKTTPPEEYAEDIRDYDANIENKKLKIK